MHLPDRQVDSIEALKERIEVFLLGLRHPVLTETGREVIDLSCSHYSLSSEYNKLLWHIWNERSNFVRQITGVRKESPGRMELRTQKFGKGPPGTLILAESRARKEQLERRSERSRYAQKLKQFLAQLFPQWKIEELRWEPDLKHSFSGCFSRAALVRGQQAWAVIGAGEQEEHQAVEGILTYGLVWRDWLRRRDNSRVWEGLKIFVPANRASTTLQRLAWMDHEVARWEVFETGNEICRRDPADVGNLKTNLAPAGGPFTLAPAFQSWVERIKDLSPEIETHFISENFCALTLRGLPFAKETPNGLVFGLGRAETPLDERTFGELQRLVANLSQIRRPQIPSQSSDDSVLSIPEDSGKESSLESPKVSSKASPQESEVRLHPYYRLYPERWLQSVLVQQIGVLGYDLVPDAIYEQVPAVSGTERGLLDLLTVNIHGRLVVLELKATEDIHMPLQAMDYWMRVHWHQKRGELERQGYFPHRVLSPQPPLLLLVSPALQFHSTCETILRYLSPSVEVVRVGLNENWRDRLQVIFRMPRQ